MLEVLPDGIVLLDEHGVIRHTNERLVILTGYTRDELVGQPSRCSCRRDTRCGRRTHGEYARDPTPNEMESERDLTVLCHDGTELSIDVDPLASRTS